ncbi:flavin-containing monooxygenase [Tsukamurella soli]|uniref:NAD(P)/FAD-dependent oxidoreductase n=1 Tax=Tsukamurella soli TaxID=644556 RepID=A0ABP8JCT8_9ACTN
MSNTDTVVEHLDVAIIGAGISGLGAARYLSVEHPDRTFAILEGRAASGGTWDLFRYPGIRSDSDLHTFGYEFAPWRDRQSIADADRILDYLRSTACDAGVDTAVRYHHRVMAAHWSSADARWTLDIERTDTGERTRLTANWVFGATGYYRYDEGFTPEFAGREDFQGTIVHPQHWPEDLDYAGKRVIVIGSGATAVTLVPAMARTAAHVIMLQRTPTYIMPVPREDVIAIALRRFLGEERGYALTRRKNIAQQRGIWLFCQRFPKLARRIIRSVNAKRLPEGFPVDEHFNPPYNPWDQRLCAVPDGDLFKAIRNGSASVVTDRIATFTAAGVRLESGRELEADIIVTATGLNLQILGGMSLTVDGEPVTLSDTVVHRGTMFSGVPNLAIAIGYTNSSWTLKVGLLCEYFCKLLRHMDETGVDTAWAEADPGMETRPLLDFGAGYVQRSLDRLPKQGTAAPWLMSKGYQEDCRLLRDGEVADRHLHFAASAALKQRELV